METTTDDNKNKYLQFVVYMLGFGILVIFAVLIFVDPKDKTNSCTSELEKFDTYIKANQIAISEQESLCYGLTTSTDFTKLEPRYAVARFIGLTLNFKYTLLFEGNKEETQMNIPLTDTEASKLVVDNYYKVDVNNFCRAFLMMADSRNPSPITETFIKPEPVECK
jgi:hypothetical protein